MRLIRITIVALALVAAGCGVSGSDAPAPSESSEVGQAASVEESEGGFAGLVDIGGGRELYLECRGTGSPTVVLVSGFRGSHDDWTNVINPDDSAGAPKPSGSAVFPEVGSFTRVCAYDRPVTTRQDGKLSPSTPVPQPTSAKVAAADLDALLRTSGEPGPYVLAGHSFGGPVIRLYAGAHPAEVGGLVLVDALSEDLTNGLTPKQQALFEELNTPPPGTRAESLDEQATFQQLRQAPPVPPVPTVVLTADRPQLTKEVLAKGQLPEGVDQEFADALWAAQLAAQEKLAKKFPDAEHITDTNSTHYIQLDNPQLVTDSIRQVVDADRDGEKTVGVVKGAD